MNLDSTLIRRGEQAKLSALMPLTVAALACAHIACGDELGDLNEVTPNIGDVQQSIAFDDPDRFVALTLYKNSGFTGSRKEIEYRYSNLAYGDRNINTESHTHGSYRSFVLAPGCEALFCKDGEDCRTYPSYIMTDAYYNSSPSHLDVKDKVWITCWNISRNAAIGRTCNAKGGDGDCLPLFDDMTLPDSYNKKNESMDINGNDYPNTSVGVKTGGSSIEKIWFVKKGIFRGDFSDVADKVTDFAFYRSEEGIDCDPANACFAGARCDGFVSVGPTTLGECRRALGTALALPGSWCNAQRKCYGLSGQPIPPNDELR